MGLYVPPAPVRGVFNFVDELKRLVPISSRWRRRHVVRPTGASANRGVDLDGLSLAKLGERD